MDDHTIDEDQVLLFMFAAQLGDFIRANGLVSYIQTAQQQMPAKKITLLVCGLSDYLTANRWLSRLAVEKALTRLQLFAGISHRLLDTAADVATTVVLFTKAVAETPFKWAI